MRSKIASRELTEQRQEDNDDDGIALLPPLPEIMPTDGRPNVDVPVLPTQVDIAPAAGVMEQQEASTSTLEHQLPQEYAVRRSA